jgi:hypothetical protein
MSQVCHVISHNGVKIADFGFGTHFVFICFELAQVLPLFTNSSPVLYYIKNRQAPQEV